MVRQKCRNNEDIFRAFSAPLSAKSFYRAAFPYLKSALEAAFSLFNGAEIQCGRNLLLFFGAHRLYRRYVLTDLEIAGFTGLRLLPHSDDRPCF